MVEVSRRHTPWIVGHGFCAANIFPPAPSAETMMKNKGLTKLAKMAHVTRQRVWNILNDYDYDSCPKCGGRKRTKSRVCRKCR